MLSKELFSEVKKMVLRLLPLLLLMVVVFSICGYFGAPLLFGTLLGGFVASLNFFLLAVTIEKSVDKGGRAQGLMGISYLLRLAIIGVAVVFAIKSPHINYLAAIIPLVFPRIIILIMNIKKGKTNDRS